MRPRVKQLWMQFNADLEGVFDFFYVDVRGLITTAMGNLCEPIELALRLEWMIDGRRATIEEVVRDWKIMDERSHELAHVYAPHQAPLTRVRLAPGAIEKIVFHQLDLNIAYMRDHFFPQWDDLPSDAHLALASEAWALGAGLDRRRPGLVRAVRRGDWAAAKREAHLDDAGNESLKKRNARHDLCFDNAATVTARKLDVALLFYPNRAPPEDDLEKVAVRALELSLARDSDPPKS